jgi:hypothetical protein
MRKLFPLNEFQAKLNVASPETAWWWFVVAMWSFVWLAWCSSSELGGGYRDGEPA